MPISISSRHLGDDLAGISAYHTSSTSAAPAAHHQRQAEADADAARLRSPQFDLVFQVSQAYYALVAARKIYRVFQQAIGQREEQVHEATGRPRRA